MKKNYSLIIALLSLALIGTMISGCGDTSEEYLTPNLSDQTSEAEQAFGIGDDAERPVDPVIRLSVPSSSLYVGSRFEATIENCGWTIGNVSWSATGARLVSSGYNHNTTWEVENATRPVVVNATVSCRYNNISQVAEASSALTAKVLPTPWISGATTAYLYQPTTYYITGIAQGHTYSWGENMYQYNATENAANKSITLTFPGYDLYIVSCTVKDQYGTALLSVRKSVNVSGRPTNPPGGDPIDPLDPSEQFPVWP